MEGIWSQAAKSVFGCDASEIIAMEGDAERSNSAGD
jgi:hypothetical protein